MSRVISTLKSASACAKVDGVEVAALEERLTETIGNKLQLADINEQTKVATKIINDALENQKLVHNGANLTGTEAIHCILVRLSDLERLYDDAGILKLLWEEVTEMFLQCR